MKSLFESLFHKSQKPAMDEAAAKKLRKNQFTMDQADLIANLHYCQKTVILQGSRIFELECALRRHLDERSN